MVDVVINNVMSTSLKPDYSQYFFEDSVSMTFPAPQYLTFHSPCIIPIVQYNGVILPANKLVG